MGEIGAETYHRWRFVERAPGAGFAGGRSGGSDSGPVGRSAPRGGGAPTHPWPCRSGGPCYPPPPDVGSRGQVAQLVEHRTENPGVTGSIPVLATTFCLRIRGDTSVLEWFIAWSSVAVRDGPWKALAGHIAEHQPNGNPPCERRFGRATADAPDASDRTPDETSAPTSQSSRVGARTSLSSWPDSTVESSSDRRSSRRRGRRRRRAPARERDMAADRHPRPRSPSSAFAPGAHRPHPPVARPTSVRAWAVGEGPLSPTRVLPTDPGSAGAVGEAVPALARSTETTAKQFPAGAAVEVLNVVAVSRRRGVEHRTRRAHPGRHDAPPGPLRSSRQPTRAESPRRRDELVSRTDV